MELLAPAGNMEKLKTALHFGADAVYVGGKSFSLRAFADNFSNEELIEAVAYTHALGRKLYVTVNIFPTDADFVALEEYVRFLDEIGVDAVIMTDNGLIALTRKIAPNLAIHVSTQANITNGHTARFYADLGAERVVLARELSLAQIATIKSMLPASCEIECFVHGAMCISYSGRCLLSSYLTPRDSNRGECVQACRWSYSLAESTRGDHPLTIEEDGRGTYILNSRDLNMIEHLADLEKAGVSSLKIEGRMKTVYYVANVVNAYRRALDWLSVHPGEGLPQEIAAELNKCNNRTYSTGFYYPRVDANVNDANAQTNGDYDFVAVVLGYADGVAEIEMRNRFAVGDTLEVLSAGVGHNRCFRVAEILDKLGNSLAEAKLVQQKLLLRCEVPLLAGDILRRQKPCK